MKKLYKIEVKLLSPLHINGGTSPSGIRVNVMQDGKSYIPATLLKGMIRNNFEMFYNTYFPELICKDKENTNNMGFCKCPSCIMFGRSGFQKSRIILDNLETNQDTIIELRVNNSIDRKSHKTKEGALVFTEVVSPLDKNRNPIIFTGNMLVYYPKSTDEYTSKMLENYLIQSIKHIKSIGLGKSRGFGFVDVYVNENVEGA